MAFVMSFAFFIRGADNRFPGVVQEHGQAQHRIRRDAFDAADRMLPEVVAVMMVLLVVIDHRADLRNNLRKHLRIFPQDAAGGFPAEEFEQFLPDPFARDELQVGRFEPQRGSSGGLDRKPVYRSEAQGAQHAQGVFLEALFRFADAADQTGCQILLPAERIRKAGIR